MSTITLWRIEHAQKYCLKNSGWADISVFLMVIHYCTCNNIMYEGVTYEGVTYKRRHMWRRHIWRSHMWMRHTWRSHIWRRHMFDWCCFCYFARNFLVALLEALCGRIWRSHKWKSQIWKCHIRRSVCCFVLLNRYWGIVMYGPGASSWASRGRRTHDPRSPTSQPYPVHP